jgi:hypothetical protein
MLRDGSSYSVTNLRLSQLYNKFIISGERSVFTNTSILNDTSSGTLIDFESVSPQFIMLKRLNNSNYVSLDLLL